MKKIFKSIISIILIALIIFIGVKTFPEAIKYRGKVKVSTDLKENELVQPELQNYQLISSIPAKGVYVYGKKLEGKPYFEQVLVKTPTSQREFNWKATTKNPRLILADITGSRQENIVIVFVTAYGTGFIESQIHVLDMALTKEIPVEEPSLAAQRLVASSVQGQEIVFKAGGREYRVTPKVGAGGIQRQYSSLQYGSIVNYAVENNKLKATVTVETPYNIFLGEFTLVYTFRNGKLVPEVVNFINLT
ncbi:MAG: hypothetical protein K0R09_539 [Clostridiales bacterium]|jgi:hypothetical protein|nr:hypothetical protein [Clostridiales bacterium]